MTDEGRPYSRRMGITFHFVIQWLVVYGANSITKAFAIQSDLWFCIELLGFMVPVLPLYRYVSSHYSRESLTHKFVVSVLFAECLIVWLLGPIMWITSLVFSK